MTALCSFPVCMSLRQILMQVNANQSEWIYLLFGARKLYKKTWCKTAPDMQDSCARFLHKFLNYYLQLTELRVAWICNMQAHFSSLSSCSNDSAFTAGHLQISGNKHFWIFHQTVFDVSEWPLAPFCWNGTWARSLGLCPYKSMYGHLNLTSSQKWPGTVSEILQF